MYNNDCPFGNGKDKGAELGLRILNAHKQRIAEIKKKEEIKKQRRKLLKELKEKKSDSDIISIDFPRKTWKQLVSVIDQTSLAPEIIAILEIIRSKSC